MFNCCGTDLKSVCAQVDCKTQETAGGIRIELSAKDPAKTESLKSLFKALRDLCGCC